MSGSCVCRISAGNRGSIAACDCGGSAELERRLSERMTLLAHVHRFLNRKGRAPHDLSTWLEQLDSGKGVALSDNRKEVARMETTPGAKGKTAEGVPYTVDEKGIARSDYDGFPLRITRPLPSESPALKRQAEEEEAKQRELEEYEAEVEQVARGELDAEYDEAKFRRAVDRRKAEIAGVR